MGVIKWVFYALPDFCGILVAVFGFVVVFMADVLKRLDKRRLVRFSIVGVFLAAGVLGMYSSHVQKQHEATEAKIKEDKLIRQVDAANASLVDLGKQVTAMSIINQSYSPKLDQIAQNLGKRSPRFTQNVTMAASCVSDSSRPYRCKTDAQLGTFILKEVAEANKIIDEYQNPILEKRERSDFGDMDSFINRQEILFTQHMIDQLPIMRALELEAIDRLGPSYKEDRDFLWTGIQPSIFPPHHMGSFQLPRQYTAYLNGLGAELLKKSKSAQ